MDIAGKVGIAVTTLGVAIGAAQLLFPEEIQAFTTATRRRVFSVVAGILAVGLFLIFFFSQSSGEGSTITTNGAGSPGVMNGGTINNVTNITNSVNVAQQRYLVPGNDPSPVSTCGTIPKGTVTVVWGGNATLVRADEPTTVMKLGKTEVRVAKYNGSIDILDMELYDGTGRYAWIAGGDVQVHDGYRILGKGTNKLTITNPSGQVLFEMRFLNPNTISINGTFFDENGQETDAWEHGAAIPNKVGGYGIFQGNCFHRQLIQ